MNNGLISSYEQMISPIPTKISETLPKLSGRNFNKVIFDEILYPRTVTATELERGQEISRSFRRENDVKVHIDRVINDWNNKFAQELFYGTKPEGENMEQQKPGPELTKKQVREMKKWSKTRLVDHIEDVKAALYYETEHHAKTKQSLSESAEKARQYGEDIWRLEGQKSRLEQEVAKLKNTIKELSKCL